MTVTVPGVLLPQPFIRNAAAPAATNANSEMIQTFFM